MVRVLNDIADLSSCVPQIALQGGQKVETHNSSHPRPSTLEPSTVAGQRALEARSTEAAVKGRPAAWVRGQPDEQAK